MTRMSQLPIAERCGAASSLSARFGAGRPAAMSKAFHAKCAGAPEAFRLIGALSPIERAEVEEWHKPADAMVNGWCLLDYASAEKELEVAIDHWGEYTDVAEAALTVGHLDFAWVRVLEQLKVAFVADIKKSVWTTPDGPESLQLHAYGRAYAKKNDCSAYCTGIWAAEEGKWLWSKDIVHLDGPKAAELWQRIAYAAANDGEASTGPHCDNCYARTHCPEYLVPALRNEHEVATLASLHPSEMTMEQRVKALEWAARAETLADMVRKNLREAVRRGECEVVREDGKRWGPVTVQGRETANLIAIRTLAPEHADLIIKRGEPFEQFRWLKGY